MAISLLRRIPAFAPLQPLALEAVARAATEIPVASGDVVMREGDAGDTFYAVCDGSFDITSHGAHVRTAERGTGFGEVALLANVPRTATIIANRAGALLAIHRVPFLIAVTGSDSSRQAAWGSSAGWVSTWTSTTCLRSIRDRRAANRSDRQRPRSCHRWRSTPGAETGWHVHEMDYVVVPLYDGSLRIESNDGTVEVELQHGRSYAREAGVEHNVINPGASEFAFVEVALKAAARRLDTFVWPVI